MSSTKARPLCNLAITKNVGAYWVSVGPTICPQCRVRITVESPYKRPGYSWTACLFKNALANYLEVPEWTMLSFLFCFCLLLFFLFCYTGVNRLSHNNSPSFCLQQQLVKGYHSILYWSTGNDGSFCYMHSLECLFSLTCIIATM